RLPYSIRLVPGSRSRVDLDRLRHMTDEEIERTSPPELANLPDDFWDSAVWMPPISKQPISLRVDDDVLEWFRKAGPRYQSRMNAVLRSYMEAMGRGTATRASTLASSRAGKVSRRISTVAK
ncbi:MAG: BrnA antitoxin family protein, partial [Gemmatimonadetes bacterium]|nr:BrnA antitoxin family protein [Gemmatimonadota bacterium]